MGGENKYLFFVILSIVKLQYDVNYKHFHIATYLLERLYIEVMVSVRHVCTVCTVSRGAVEVRSMWKERL